LRECTIEDAGSIGIQQTDRTARTKDGRRLHHWHSPVASGCPQRPHCGDGRRGNLAQQR
jgi:hypothetical protein